MRFQEAVESLKQERPAFTTEKTIKDAPRKVDPLTTGQRHILNCYLIKIYKVAFNRQPKFRHVGDRCKALVDLARKYRDGFPWANNPRLKELATPILVGYAEALAKQLEDLEKVKYGRDLGRIDS